MYDNIFIVHLFMSNSRQSLSDLFQLYNFFLILTLTKKKKKNELKKKLSGAENRKRKLELEKNVQKLPIIDNFFSKTDTNGK